MATGSISSPESLKQVHPTTPTLPRPSPAGRQPPQAGAPPRGFRRAVRAWPQVGRVVLSRATWEARGSARR
jgi:hypothetical protein